MEDEEVEWVGGAYHSALTCPSMESQTPHSARVSGPSPNSIGSAGVLLQLLPCLLDRRTCCLHHRLPVPSVFGRKLQCQPVRKWPLKRNAIDHTRQLASSEQAWEPMASSSLKLCRKTAHRTAIRRRSASLGLDEVRLAWVHSDGIQSAARSAKIPCAWPCCRKGLKELTCQHISILLHTLVPRLRPCCIDVGRGQVLGALCTACSVTRRHQKVRTVR
jgi:hypothetical protein